MRNLTYLQAIVEQKQIPLITNQRDSTASNVYMVQGMEHTDDRGVILLTVPHSATRQDDDQNNTPAAGEGYSLTRLIDGR